MFSPFYPQITDFKPDREEGTIKALAYARASDKSA